MSGQVINVRVSKKLLWMLLMNNGSLIPNLCLLRAITQFYDTCTVHYVLEWVSVYI